MLVREASLRLADDERAAFADQVTAHLDAVYGITHPEALARLVPTVTATVRALHGLHQDHARVDRVVGRQLRHTSMLDGRALTSRGDVDWSLQGVPSELQWPPRRGVRRMSW